MADGEPVLSVGFCCGAAVAEAFVVGSCGRPFTDAVGSTCFGLALVDDALSSCSVEVRVRYMVVCWAITGATDWVVTWVQSSGAQGSPNLEVQERGMESWL